MNKKNFRFWVTFIILIGLSCEGAFYYKHHVMVKHRAAVAQEAAKQHAADLAAGPITSKKFTRQDFPVTLSADGSINNNESDPTYADINFTLPEANMDDVDIGQEITFVVDELPNVFFKGEVYAMDSDSNPDTHEFGIKAMASNPDHQLQPDMSADIKMVIDIHQNAMVIPESAIITKDNHDFVYVIENGNAKLTPVKLGVHQDDVAEVIDGAIDGKNIITSGTDHIHDGAPVVMEPPAKTE
jgi:membrane fusion protein (multidrug efflux system)